MVNKIKSTYIIVLIITFFALGSKVSAFTDKSIVEEKSYCYATLEDDFAEDIVIIVLNNSESLAFKDYDIMDFAEVDCISVEDLTESTCKIVKQQVSAKKTGDWTALNERIEKNMLIDINAFHRILCLTINNSSKEKVLESIKILEKRSEILSVNPDYIEQVQSFPDDPMYPRYPNIDYSGQWGLNGPYGINVEKAWNITRGNSTVLVGVLDSGIDGKHPDLINVINDDLHRDYVDKTFFGNAKKIKKEDLKDSQYHGTHVAGIIGAEADNGRGITGVAWNIRLISLRVFDGSKGANSSDVQRAIDFATSKNIPILNFSGGGHGEHEGLREAIKNYPGLFVCAAGNEYKNNDVNECYPANHNFDNLITVGASGADGKISHWGTDEEGNPHGSNYGSTNVDIFAPGTSILSTVPIDYYSYGYHVEDGTSMAAPHVAGVAALMLSINPNLTPAQLKFTIMNNATKSTDLNGLCVCNGRLDAFKAISAVAYSTSIVNGEITINGFVDSCSILDNPDLEIPEYFAPISSEYGTLQIPVTTIGDSAFKNKGNLKNVVIPNSVRNINSSSFEGCYSLTKVTLSDELTYIGNSAFKDCVSLNSIVIPNNVTNIDSSAFENCSSLHNITLSDSLIHIGSSAFKGCANVLTIAMSNNVTNIGSSAFENCSYLQNVTFSNKLVTIGSSAFEGCTGLFSITIPNSVASIGYAAFKGCSNLTRITLPFVGGAEEDEGINHFGYIFGASEYNNNNYYVPTSLKEVDIRKSIKIDVSAFQNCRNLKHINLSNTVTNIGQNAFSDCINLTSITLQNGLTSIGSSAFKACASLSSITIPNSVTSIGYAAFEGCYNLQNITLPFVGGSEEDEDINYFGYIFGANTHYENSNYVPTNLKNVVLTACTKIGSFSFYNCRRLESITIPNGLTSIGSSAFKNCTSLPSISIPSTVTIIDSNAFEGCIGLTSITLQNGLTSIGSFSFKGCRNLESISVPGTVTIIDSNAFEGCTGLTSITLQNGLTSIGSFAFKGCWNIPSISVPSTVTIIDSNAFEGCTGLTNITLQNGLTSIGSFAFKGCRNLESISVPSTVTIIDSNAFEDCTSVTSITLQNGLTSIGSSAFKDCMNITSIRVPSTVINIDSSAFEGCIRLQTLTLSNNLTSIGDSAFKGCRRLSTITIPNSVTNIGSSAFEGCTSLQTLTLSNNLISIGSSAFKGCRNLSNLTIPSSVEDIDDEAFINCLYLENVTVERAKSGLTNLGENVFSGCSDELEIIVPINRIAEYKNKQNWSSYRNKIITLAEYQELDIDCESNLNSSISLNAGYNKLYKLNVNCSKSYKMNASALNTITIIVYNEDMNVIDNSSNIANIFLSCGTYYLSLEFADITTSGSIETNISLRWPSSEIQLLYGTNNIKANFHNITGNMSHGKFYYINNKGAGFFKFKLNAGNNAAYPEGAITIYDSQRTILDRYAIPNESVPSISNVGENELYIYLPKNGYYYIDIVVPTGSYTTITFTIEEAEKQNINYLNRLDEIGFDEIFFNQTSTNYFKEVTISHRSKIELDIQASRRINENIPVYILEKYRDPGYEPGVDHYYIVPKLVEEITKTNWAPVFTVILDPGTYYIGYSDNVENLGIHVALKRKVNKDLNIGGTLVTDPGFGVTLGSEVTFNNGEVLGNTITKGFTRNIYLMVEDRLRDPMSRLEYDWYSSNESAAKVTKYGTVLGMSVTEDTPVKIYAVNKADPSIVYSINLTIVDNTIFEEIVIESNMTYSYSKKNGTYQIDLDFTNCPYPYIQYYGWNIYPEDPIQVSIDHFGHITSSGVGEAIIIGSYDLNIRVTMIIHLTITE